MNKEKAAVGGKCEKCGDVAARADIRQPHIDKNGKYCNGEYRDMVGRIVVNQVNNKIV